MNLCSIEIMTSWPERGRLKVLATSLVTRVWSLGPAHTGCPLIPHTCTQFNFKKRNKHVKHITSFVKYIKLSFFINSCLLLISTCTLSSLRYWNRTCKEKGIFFKIENHCVTITESWEHTFLFFWRNFSQFFLLISYGCVPKRCWLWPQLEVAEVEWTFTVCSWQLANIVFILAGKR